MTLLYKYIQSILSCMNDGFTLLPNNIMSNINKPWITITEGVDTSKQVQPKRFAVMKDFGHKVLNIISWEKKRQEKKLENDRLLAQKQEKLQQRMNLVEQEIDTYIQKATKEFQIQNEEIERRNTTCPNCQGKDVVDHILSWCTEWKGTTLTVCHCNWCSNEWFKKWKKKNDVEYITRLGGDLAGRLQIVIGECLYHKNDEDIDPNDSSKLNKERVQNLCEQIEKMPGFKDLSIESLEYLKWLREQYLDGSCDPYDYRFGENTVNVLKQLWFKYWLEQS